MPLARLASRCTLGFASLGFLALLASHAGAAPTDDHRRTPRVSASSPTVVVTAAIDDGYRVDRSESRGPTRPNFEERGRRDSHAPSGPGRGMHEFPDRPRGHHDRGDHAHPSTPIPEAASLVLFTAGLGLVGMIVTRRKLD